MRHEPPLPRADQAGTPAYRRNGAPIRSRTWLLSFALHGAALVIGLYFSATPQPPSEPPAPCQVSLRGEALRWVETDDSIVADLEEFRPPDEGEAQLPMQAPQVLPCESDTSPYERDPWATEAAVAREDPQSRAPLFFEVPLTAVNGNRPRKRETPQQPNRAPESERPLGAAPALVRAGAAARPADPGPHSPVHTGSSKRRADAVQSSATSSRRVARTSPGRRAAALRVRHAPRMGGYYPPQSRRQRQQGTAVVELLINEHGIVVQAELTRSTGYPRLDEAALRLARDYRFEPPGIRRRARIPISFVLRS